MTGVLAIRQDKQLLLLRCIYAAFDYFNAGKSIPNQNYRPAVGTTLQRYIFNRQQNSFWDNKDRWGELFVNPGGARTDEFFNWGLQRTNGGRVDELRQTVGGGQPVPLGLFKAGNGGAGPHHQVLAIGYEIGSRPEELKIKIYDPNYPNSVQTLVPDVAGKRYYYLESPTDSWQTYFVDKKYRAASPPNITSQSTIDDGFVRELMVDIATGGDDLRGQNDNVHAIVNFRSGQSQTFTNINLLQRWIDNYSETVPLVLRQPVRKEDITGIVLTTTFRGNIGGDNWNIDRFTAWYLQPNRIIYDRSGTPLVRLTGDNKSFTTRFWTNLLTVTLRTGGDDLRGGNEGFITLHYRDGSNSIEYRLNQGRTLSNNSTNSILLDVPLDVTAERIAGVTIRHHGDGRSLGEGYDNWNLDGLQIQVNGTTVLNLNGTPLIRFTGNLRSRRWDR